MKADLGAFIQAVSLQLNSGETSSSLSLDRAHSLAHVLQRRRPDAAIQLSESTAHAEATPAQEYVADDWCRLFLMVSAVQLWEQIHTHNCRQTPVPSRHRPAPYKARSLLQIGATKS